MPDRRRDAVPNFPPYLSGGRRAGFLLLLLLAAFETGAQIWTGQALTGVIRSSADMRWAIASLIAAFSILMALFWARGVLAEWIGQDYVNDVRAGLARQAVRSALGRGRLGTISARMSADLAALKNWSDAGVCGAITGTLTLTAGLLSALTITGIVGLLSCLAGPAVSIFIVLVLWIPLRARIRLRRAARGLLSARTGDAVFAARTAAIYGASEKFVRPIRRAGRRLAAASVKALSLVQLHRASGTITVPAGILLFVSLRENSADMSASVWGGFVYSLGLCSAGVALLVPAAEALIERRVAVQKLRELDNQANEAPALTPVGVLNIPTNPVLALSVDGRILAKPGELIELSRSSFPDLTLRLMKGGDGVVLGDLQSSLANPGDWARRVGIVSECIPLPRGMVREIVKTRGRPTKRQIKEAFLLAGIDPDNTGLPSVIDPQRHMLEPFILSRLRLVRGLVASPHALIIDEPWLAADLELKRRLQEWARDSGRAVLWLSVQ